ncbi:dual oxidase isoform X2 [Lepeophtheirus salmonis]|uniref:dual oxidase isoform X2 n=1 Tax=Lepeophtheirus salmonis TaxID=72036 RepID=UPI003AF35821
MELIFFSKYIILELYFCLFLLSSGQDVRKRVEYNKDFNTTNTDYSPLIQGSTYGEKQRYDGWYNNLAHPSWGSIGQLVSAEILMASELGCPIEMAKIEIEKCDEMYDEKCEGTAFMPFHRAYYDRRTGQSPNSPREQLNRMTSWIDGSFIYSTKEAWVNTMRTFSNGLLKTNGDAIFGLPTRNKDRVPLENRPAPHVLRMLNPERMFILGDPRVNQNPGFLALGIVFYRWHNFQALKILKKHPDWEDEDIFQAARRRVIATLQNIIMYEFLPSFLGKVIPPYESYKPDIHPGISHVFQSAAFRFGHSTIPPGIYRRDRNCNYKKTASGGPAMRLCSTWWDSQDEINEDAVEEILLGLSSQISEKEDAILCSDVRNKLFGPMEFSRRDLAALNIMRGRDNGLADYNTVRKCNGFSMINTFEEINPKLANEDPDIFVRLRNLYKDVNNIDLYVGGMLESVDGPGPLFSKIIKDEFLRIRDADRFWFENVEHGTLTETEILEIKTYSLSIVIKAVTDLSDKDLQGNVFFWKDGNPCPQPGQLNATTLEECPFLTGYDYFQGSEVTYIYSCIILCFVPLITSGAAYGVIKLMNRRRRKMKTLREDNNNGKKMDSMTVKEWLHQNAKRPVKVKFGPDESFYLLNRKGEKLRTVNVKNINNMIAEVTQDNSGKKPMLLLRVIQDYDLVLEFSGISERKKFLNKLENFLGLNKRTLETISCFREIMLANAETKERRKMRLEHFFREAYALTFGLKPGEKRKLEDVTSDVIMVMRTSLSKKEFAQALGMKDSDVFVTKMFNIVDKDNDNRISFQEFLDTIVLFSKGRTDDKLRIIFDMCDDDKNGFIDKKELSELLNSLVDIAKTQKLSEQNVNDLINSMFHSAGFEDKESLTYDDFKTMMKEFKGDFLAIGLDCKGAKQNYLDATTNVARMQSFGLDAIAERRKSNWLKRWEALTNFLEENRQHIFFLFTFFVITIALFVERFIFYAFMSEHLDLRHIMGVGIAITRGSAASLSFCYCLLLLSMCRNLITKMKEHSLHQYIPLDSHLQFHKICACTALFFTILHSIGHLVNFYHVATQPIEHLHCLTKEFNFSSDFRPNISFWLFRTLTGLTGIILYIVVTIIFIFAHPMVRKRAFNYFWITHQLYVFLYIFSLLHGLARLTGPPRFWIFFVVPGVVYSLDKIATFRTRYMALDILETELLPSDVIKIKFYRPPNMKVLSGQWIRVSCTALKPEEFHSFTLTSAPHEDFLSIHVKAQGPYTWKLRNLFDQSLINKYGNQEKNEDPPKIRIEGPFGGGNQDWYKFEVAVMVGGGIGVTPYASILNDLVFGTSTNRYSGVACKKVYFLWICPSHRYFEWFIDVLRDVERKDVTDVLEMHIFITQFFHKFDLRTTMLYICENHFQRLQKRSMFTGLKAINHFGRPDMPAFLKFVQKKHSYVSKVGVFSCGPGPLTNSINNACEAVNRMRKLPYFIHHYENFG